MSTRGLIFIAGIIVGFFVGMLSFSSHGAGKLYGNCVHTCDNKNSKEIHRNILPVDLEHKEKQEQVKCYVSMRVQTKLTKHR